MTSHKYLLYCFILFYFIWSTYYNNKSFANGRAS